MKKILAVIPILLLLCTVTVSAARENTQVTIYGEGGTRTVTLTPDTPYYHNGADGQLGTADNDAEGANISASWEEDGTAVLQLSNACLNISVKNNLPLISLSGSATVVVPKGDESSFSSNSNYSPVFYLKDGTLRFTGSGCEERDGLLTLKTATNADPYSSQNNFSNSIVMTAKTYNTKTQPYVVQVDSLRLRTSGLYGFGSFSSQSGCNEDILIENSDIDLYSGYYGINGSRITIRNTTGRIRTVGKGYNYGNDALHLNGKDLALSIEDSELSIFGERDFAQFIMNDNSATAIISIKNSRLDLTGSSNRSGDGALEIWNRKSEKGSAELKVTDSEVTIHSLNSRPININGLQSSGIELENSTVTLISEGCTTDGVLLKSNAGANLTLSDTLLDIRMAKGNACIRLFRGNEAGTLTLTGQKTELIGSVDTGYVLHGPNDSVPLYPAYLDYYPRVRAAAAASGSPLDFNEINPAADVYKDTAYRYLHITPARHSVTYTFAGGLIPADVTVPDPCEADYMTAYTAEQPGLSETLLFVGWFTDPEGTVPYIDGTLVDKDLILYGYWEKKPPVTGDPADPLLFMALAVFALAGSAAVYRRKLR